MIQGILRLPKRSLRYKFIVTLAAFTVVLSVSFGFISAQRLKGELERQVLERGYRLVRELAPNILHPSNRTSQQLLSILKIYESIIQPVGGEILFIQAVKEDQSAVIPPEITESLDLSIIKMTSTEQLVKRRLPQVGTPYLDLMVAITPPQSRIVWEPGKPVRIEEVPPAYIRVGLSLEYVEGVVRREILKISGLSALYILLGLAIAFWLYKSILGPIETLTQSVKRFKRDRHARARVTSGDELQTLAEEFNRMADSIQERDERLERINQQLRKANRVKSEFLAVMGHELKTPLHAIRGYSQLLLEGIDGPLTPAQREDLENILKSGDHLRALIDNVLQFSKLESGEEEIHPSLVEVEPLIEEALQNVKLLAREKEIQVLTQPNGIKLYADETKLKQILINLLSNALKYTSRGRVEVVARQGQGEILFTVRDTGIGIPKEHHEKIFEPFTQIDSSSTRPWVGIGLGLSIVKRYVEMHGGRIWVESSPGRGSAFHFTIPEPKRGGE